MKEKFLALVEEVKKTHIVDEIYKTSNADELRLLKLRFADKHSEIFANVKNWAIEFDDFGEVPIFFAEEEIQNPMEIVIILQIIDDIWTSEEELFENEDKFSEALNKQNNRIATAIANLMRKNLICNITAEDIFSYIDENI